MMDYDISKKIAELLDKKTQLETELRAELALRNAELHVSFEKGRAFFKDSILKKHKEKRINAWKYMSGATLGSIITAPVIYFGLIVFIFLDIFVTIYQHICFRTYGIPRVKRSQFFSYNRSALPYLNIIQKINCAYCSYGNGTIAYAREVAALTEEYWCPIKHADLTISGYHDKYAKFADYGDAEGFVVLTKKEINIKKNPAD